MATSPICGTTCPGVCTATTFAQVTWRRKQSAPRQPTGSVGAKKVFTRLMTSVSGTQSVAPDTGFKLKVQYSFNKYELLNHPSIFFCLSKTSVCLTHFTLPMNVVTWSPLLSSLRYTADKHRLWKVSRGIFFQLIFCGGFVCKTSGVLQRAERTPHWLSLFWHRVAPVCY